MPTITQVQVGKQDLQEHQVAILPEEGVAVMTLLKTMMMMMTYQIGIKVVDEVDLVEQEVEDLQGTQVDPVVDPTVVMDPHTDTTGQ